MTMPLNPFRPDELTDPATPESEDELRAAILVARELDAAVPPESVRPSAGFSDRVMAAIAGEPSPRAGGFLDGFRGRTWLGGLVASLRAAWRAVADGTGRPIAARGMALGYVVAVLLVVGSLTSVTAVGAANVFQLFAGPEASPTTSPLVVSPSPSPSPSTSPVSEPSGVDEPSPSAEPGDSGEPGGSAEPSHLPEPTESEGPHASEGPTAAPSQTAGPSPTPSQSDDDHHDGSPSPSPSRTPRPSGTAQPTSSPS